MSSLIKYRVNPGSISSAGMVIKKITDAVFIIQEDFMAMRYKRIYDLTKSRTMVATGHLRSRLYNRKQRVGYGSTLFECGYGSTLNNQSWYQEFDTFGKVHHTKSEHYWAKNVGDKAGSPRCSISPVNLFEMYGSYKSNRNARRRALASSIEDSLSTSVHNAVISGNNMTYQPDLSETKRRLSSLTRAFLRYM